MEMAASPPHKRGELIVTNSITPPPELIEQWMQAHSTKYDLARHAAQWGYEKAIEELEAFLKKDHDKD
jgi:hypothetical protein